MAGRGRGSPCRPVSPLPLPSPPRASPPLRAASRGRAEAGAAPGGRRGWGGPCKLGVCGGERGEGAPSWPIGISGCGPPFAPSKTLNRRREAGDAGGWAAGSALPSPAWKTGCGLLILLASSRGGARKRKREGVFLLSTPLPRASSPAARQGWGSGGSPGIHPGEGNSRETPALLYLTLRFLSLFPAKSAIFALSHDINK